MSDLAARLTVRPCGITVARVGVARVHRHRGRRVPPSALAAFEVVRGGWPVGWALLGRPSSPTLQARGYVEVTRVAVEEGNKGACSMLYGACARAARRLARPVTTYTLRREPGVSLRGAGWVPVALVAAPRGRGWANRPGRGDQRDREPKVRWEPRRQFIGPEVGL